ncbi:MAG: MOSC domain-containing protein [Myxococcota bacterium]
MAHASDDTARLLAVCVGQPREASWQGERLRTSFFKSRVPGRLAADALGLAGDSQTDRSVHGGVDKAVYAYTEESAAYWREQLSRSDLDPGAFGENLRIRGWPEATVCIGDRFRVGTACLEVSQPRQPCSKLAMRFDDAGFPKRFIKSHRVGYYLRVVEPGELGAGDRVERVFHDAESLDIERVVALWLDRAASEPDLARAVALPALADAWKLPLRDRLDAARR